MPTRITQFDAPELDSTVLKVEGSLCLEDAQVLERLCHEIAQDSGHAITLDLADLSFIDGDSAEVLSRLKRERGVRLEGLHLFVQKIIELADVTDDPQVGG
jgi:anti-anti-sigma regulatory factor